MGKIHYQMYTNKWIVLCGLDWYSLKASTVGLSLKATCKRCLKRKNKRGGK